MPTRHISLSLLLSAFVASSSSSRLTRNAYFFSLPTAFFRLRKQNCHSTASGIHTYTVYNLIGMFFALSARAIVTVEKCSGFSRICLIGAHITHTGNQSRTLSLPLANNNNHFCFFGPPPLFIFSLIYTLAKRWNFSSHSCAIAQRIFRLVIY